MKLLIFLLMSSGVFASEIAHKIDSFTCGDGETYDVVRRIYYGYVNTYWEFQHLCEPGSLTKKEYGRGDFEEDRLEFEACTTNSNESVEAQACTLEFLNLNLSGDDGEHLPFIQNSSEMKRAKKVQE